MRFIKCPYGLMISNDVVNLMEKPPILRLHMLPPWLPVRRPCQLTYPTGSSEDHRLKYTQRVVWGICDRSQHGKLARGREARETRSRLGSPLDAQSCMKRLPWSTLYSWVLYGSTLQLFFMTLPLKHEYFQAWPVHFPAGSIIGCSLAS